MKKITLIVITLITSLSLYAQETRIGITAGLLNAGGRVEFDNEQEVNNNRQGIYAGLVLDLSLIHI